MDGGRRRERSYDLGRADGIAACIYFFLDPPNEIWRRYKEYGRFLSQAHNVTWKIRRQSNAISWLEKKKMKEKWRVSKKKKEKLLKI